MGRRCGGLLQHSHRLVVAAVATIRPCPPAAAQRIGGDGGSTGPAAKNSQRKYGPAADRPAPAPGGVRKASAVGTDRHLGHHHAAVLDRRYLAHRVDRRIRRLHVLPYSWTWCGIHAQLLQHPAHMRRGHRLVWKTSSLPVIALLLCQVPDHARPPALDTAIAMRAKGRHAGAPESAGGRGRASPNSRLSASRPSGSSHRKTGC